MNKLLALVSTLLFLAMASCGASNADAGGGNDQTGGSGGSGGSNTGGSGAVSVPPPPAPWPELEGESKGSGAPQSDGNQLSFNCGDFNPDYLEQLLDFVPADANASGSAVLAREALQQGRSPVPAHLRTQELFSHYAPRFATQSGAEPQVLVQLRQHEAIDGLYELLVGIELPTLAPEARPPVSLTIVIDTTESMTPVLPRAKNALTALAAALLPGDLVEWVTSDPNLDLPELTITGADDAELLTRTTLLEAVTEEHPLALTDLIARGVAVARSHAKPAAWNRMLVITDGEGEIDATTHQAIKDATMQDDLLVVPLGVGKVGESSPTMLRLLSHAGRGPYIQLDDGDASFLHSRFNEIVGKTFDQLELSLRLPWYFEIERPYLFETTAVGGAEPQYLAPGQVVMFPFRLVACNPFAVADTDIIHVSFRMTDPATGAPMPIDLSFTIGQLTAAAAAELAQVFAVVAYGDALRTMDSLRLKRAYDLAFNIDNAAMKEIAGLLLQHPAYPQQ